MFLSCDKKNSSALENALLFLVLNVCYFLNHGLFWAKKEIEHILGNTEQQI
jgi:hypothetical protein